MKPRTSDLERARRKLDQQWNEQLASAAPDWLLLFTIHHDLALLERRLARLRRSV